MSTDKSKAAAHHKGILKSSGVVASGVLASRATGFLRDVIIAQFLGTGFVAEAFLVAQRIPNLLRDLVGEGAANSAIVPVLSEYSKKKTKEEWHECINAVMTWGFIILGGMTVLGIILAPWIVKLIAPGFAKEPGQMILTANLTRIMFPYLILIALTAFQAGILYSMNVFFSPSFGPCLLNIAMILGVWVASFFSLDLAYTLSFAVLVGGVWQFLVQWYSLRRCGVYWKMPLTLKNTGAIKIGKLLLPRIWGSTVYQINVFVDTLCASFATIVGAGGIAAIYYANRIIQFPLGVFGYALSSVVLPSLSKLAQEGDMAHFRSTLFFALRNLMLVLVPTAILMTVFSTWIIHIVFQRGAFNAYSTQVTSSVMFYTAIGLPFFGMARILASAFFALHDTKTPVVAATVCLVINVVLNVVLMYPLKVGGIALASSISSLVNCLLLWNGLRKKIYKD